MTAEFHRLGLRFLYPENWELTVEEEAEPQSVTVQNETGAFWSVAIYGELADPMEMASGALAALRDEYEELEEEFAEEELVGHKLHGFDVQFYVQHLIASARIRAFPFGQRTCLVLCQAEDRDFEDLIPVFQAMTISLLQSLKS